MQKLGFSLLVIFTAISILTVPCLALTSTTVYVAGDGSGDFNCDGLDDHIQINNALDYAAQDPQITTVYLKGPFTYVINDTVRISSNTTLTGDSTAVIKLANSVSWPIEKAMISNKNLTAGSLATGDHDIVICGFEIDGNRDGNKQVSSGKGYHNLFYFKYCSNVSIHHMYLHDNHGDGVKFTLSNNLKYHDNIIYRLGHDGLYAIKSTNIEAYNNKITCRTNSGLRLYNSNHAKLHHNVITSNNEGGAGIEVQKESNGFAMDDIEIYNNTIYRTAYAAIWVFGHGNLYPKEQTLNLHIHHNTIYDCGLNGSGSWVGGIVLNGFHNALIEHNIFDDCYGAAIAHKTVYSSPAPGSGYVTLVRNNIIINTKPHSAAGPGVGISNNLPSTHSFIISNNCLWNNAGGNYYNASSTSDLYADPLLVRTTRY